MGWTDTFGAGAISPNVVAFRAISLTANQTLVWPIQNGTSPDVVAATLEVTPSGAGLSITMPDATQWSRGPVTLFGNIGASTFTVKDSAGGTIVTVAAGVWKFLILTANATAAGTWLSFTFGTGTSAADAAALAGLGLVVLTGLLNVDHPVTSHATDQTVTTAWRATTRAWTGGAGTFTFSGLPSGFFALIRNAGTGALTLAAASIDGGTSVALNPTDSCIVVGAGSDTYYTVGQGRATTFPITRLLLSVAGAANVTLSTAQAANLLQEYTGALTGNIAVIVPTAVGLYFVTNNTTGAFTLTVKTAAGTGIAVEQSKRAVLYCDGTNVVDAGPWRTPIANLPMGAFKFTGLGNGTAQTDSLAAGQVLSNSLQYSADTGAANAYLLTPPIALAAYADGQRFVFQPANGNTASATVNISGQGLLTMKRMTNVGIQNLVGGEIVQNGMTDIVVDQSVGAIVLNPVKTGFVGSIEAWGGATAPTGTVFCFGQAVSRTAEPYLAAFSALATTWGVGDGATTYNLPDLRGRGLFGRDDMGGAAANRITNAVSGIVGTTLGAVGGSQSLTAHTHTGPSHTHDFAHTHNLENRTAPSSGGLTSLFAAGVAGGANTPGTISQSTTTTSAAGTGASGSTGAGASENMPPAAIVNFILVL